VVVVVPEVSDEPLVPDVPVAVVAAVFPAAAVPLGVAPVVPVPSHA
jgi:hypothetical protein